MEGLEVERYAALAFLAAVGRRWFRLGLRGRFLGGLRLLFRGKLRSDLLGDGVGVHLVVLGGVFERLAGLRLRPGCVENDGLDEKLSEFAFLGLANIARPSASRWNRMLAPS